jgi:environmental stress-induced protein Ves
MLNFVQLSDCSFIPWKNNGGVTQELYKTAEDPFYVRISVATVTSDGPFSFFPDHDRVLILLEGSLRLNISGIETELNPYAPLFFSGTEIISSKLINKVVRDFNFICLKGLIPKVQIMTFLEDQIEIHKGQFLYVCEGEVRYEDKKFSETLFFGEGFLSPDKDYKGILISL